MNKDTKEWLVKGIAKNFIGKRAIHLLGFIYRAGTSLEKGIAYIEKSYYEKQRYSALDVLGESAEDEFQALFSFDTYKSAIPLIARATHQRRPGDALLERFGDEAISSISMKASAICYIEDPTNLQSLDMLEDRLIQLAQPAKEEGIGVTIDAEDHNWSDLELNVAKRLWDKGYNNLGMVLQARLKRTDKDVKAIKDYVSKRNDPEYTKKIRVRACIGAYNETVGYAEIGDKAVKRRLVDTIKGLFDAGVYVEIATHDHNVINEVMGYIGKNNIENDRFEFQFLKGILSGESIEPKLKAKGYKVRVYMPIETKKFASVPYVNRRLLESPSLVSHYIKNIIKKGIRFCNPCSREQYRYK